MSRFYVYRLIDPRVGRPFYVGKGQRARAWEHEAEARSHKGSNLLKRERIMDIIRETGSGPHVEIVARFDDEEMAYLVEMEMIAATRGLTNILEGGQGGWSLTAEEMARRAALKRRRHKQDTRRRQRAVLTKWLDGVSKWPGVTFPGVPDGDAKAQEMVTAVRQLLAEGAD